MSHQRKKKKTSKPPILHTLNEDDIEKIFTQVTVSMEEIIDKVKSIQKENYD